MAKSSINFLQRQIDLIAVPVFVADETVSGEFRFAAINSAHAKLTGFTKSAVRGRTPHDLAGAGTSADKVVERFRECIAADAPISYSDTIICDGAPTLLDTTLQKIPLPKAACHRIVGTAVTVGDQDAAGADIEYYLSLTRRSLTTIEMLLSPSVSARSLSASEREATLILCRKALLSLEDIARVAGRIVRAERTKPSEDATDDLRMH